MCGLRLTYLIGLLFVGMGIHMANAQDKPRTQLRRERTVLSADSLSDAGTIIVEDTVGKVAEKLTLQFSDSLQIDAASIEVEAWMPDPKKALWLAIVFPGGGQIYNRKYWKLPLFYGGFLGCAYAINWNNTMYRDYSQAYIDIMDDDPNTKSYENFLPPTYDVNSNINRLKTLFKRKKDYYRRYRDLSLFCVIGVYALSIIDAYVDAELSSFDISRDLSMKVRPSIINDRHHMALGVGNSLMSNSYGVQCSFSF
ncbi:MAG: hypothetical protein J1F25_04155 [Prevotellaceae bacterium]|nr:hypothetical protein [Prevotellaceae bacterium]